ncbi:hypothetical protein PMAYCL1PPCAC_20585, partial [Pristionchus mayeri]
LARCKLKLVRIDGTQAFPRLRTLNLKGNEISDWESIGQLRKLQSLAILDIDCKNLSTDCEMEPDETLATVTMLVSINYEEDVDEDITKLIHAAQSEVSSQILTDKSELAFLSTGLKWLEYTCVREVAFQLNYDHPHTSRTMASI